MLAGLAAEAALFWWVACSEISGDVYLICYSLLMPAVALLTAVVAFNSALQRWLPVLAFRRSEVLTVYIMLISSLPVAGFGMMRFLIPSVVYPAYMAQKIGGRWEQLAQHLPSWLAPKNPTVITGFFEGSSRVPWGDWLVPIACWGALFLALITAQLALTIMLRRQWIEAERLTFPIVYLPLRMTEQPRRFFADRLMWLGFAGPFVMQSLLAINYLYPAVPARQLKAYFFSPFVTRPWSEFGAIPIGFYPIAIGLAYLIPTDVSFSCWFFYFLVRLVNVVAAALGLDTTRAVSVSTFPYFQEQAAGAWIGFAALTLWVGRRELGRVLRETAGRRAAIALAASMIFIFGFTAMAGLPAWLAIGIFVIYMMYVISAARVRAEVGTQWTFAPLVWTPNAVFMLGLGTRLFAENAMTNMAVLEGITVDVRGQPMPNHMESLKIAEQSRLDRGKVMTLIVVATVTGLALAFYTSFWHWYHTGLMTAKADKYHIYKVALNFTQLESRLQSPTSFNRAGLGAMGFAGVFTWALAILRGQFTRWPFHPLGYVLSNTLTVGAFWLPMMIANVSKVLVLRYGGARSYRRSIALFVGIILGDVVAETGWTLAGRIGHFPVYQFLT